MKNSRKKKPMAPKTATFHKLAELYERMAEAYDETARAIGFSCQGCEDNCCTSYFQHHTYVEWIYLWKGMDTLPEGKRAEYLARAEDNVRQSRALMAQGLKPRLMCPLNDDGLCGIYSHRLMICRMHGVPNILTHPDGRQIRFAGCYRCQGLTQDNPDAPFIDRTFMYRELAALEMEFLGKRLGKLPKVDLTLSEMLVAGPPPL